MEKLYIVSKTKTRIDYGSDHGLLFEIFKLKLKKVRKTTKPFRYDLNQIPDDYTVQFSSVVQSCPTLCNPMNHSTPGLPLVIYVPPVAAKAHSAMQTAGWFCLADSCCLHLWALPDSQITSHLVPKL